MSSLKPHQGRPPRAITIAGSDSGGGAGIEADLKTFTVLRVFGMAAITSVTAQNTQGVTGVHNLPPEFVAEQIDDVADDIGIDAAKTGMLANAGIIEAVAASIQRAGIKQLVIDPVMVSKSGHSLLEADARTTLIEKLLPLATIITPNLPEAEALTGRPVRTDAEIREAARRIHGMGARAVVIKGGHVESGDATDCFHDGDRFETITAERVHTKNTHGTGCTFSAAIAAYLARGEEPFDAVCRAKEYLTGAIQRAFDLGHGHGPLNHYWTLEDESGAG